MPRPRAESSLKYGKGSNAISGGMTPVRLTNPFTIHCAAIEGGTPVSTTPPPTFHFSWGHVTASYRKVIGFPSFSPTRTQRWMSTSSSGSFGFEKDGNPIDRKSTRLNSSHLVISYAVFCLKKKNNRRTRLGRSAAPAI